MSQNKDDKETNIVVLLEILKKFKKDNKETKKDASMRHKGYKKKLILNPYTKKGHCCWTKNGLYEAPCCDKKGETK